MTPEQSQALATHIRANTDQAVIDALAIRNDVLMAELYNAASTFVVWKPRLSASAARDAISQSDGLAQLDNLTVGKRETLLWTFAGDTFPANEAQRNAIIGLCGTQNTLKAVILAAQKRVATKAEQVFATGTGSDASPGVLGWDGLLGHPDISQALNNY